MKHYKALTADTARGLALQDLDIPKSFFEQHADFIVGCFVGINTTLFIIGCVFYT